MLLQECGNVIKPVSPLRQRHSRHHPPPSPCPQLQRNAAVGSQQNMRSFLGAWCAVDSRSYLLLYSAPRHHRFGMSLSARLCVATFFILSCMCCARATSQSETLRESGAALIDTLYASRKQATNGGVNLAQQQIQNPRHAGVPPAEEGSSLLQLSRVFPPRLASRCFRSEARWPRRPPG